MLKPYMLSLHPGLGWWLLPIISFSATIRFKYLSNIFQRLGYKTGGRESFALIREYNSGI